MKGVRRAPAPPCRGSCQELVTRVDDLALPRDGLAPRLPRAGDRPRPRQRATYRRHRQGLSAAVPRAPSAASPFCLSRTRLLPEFARRTYALRSHILLRPNDWSSADAWSTTGTRRCAPDGEARRGGWLPRRSALVLLSIAIVGARSKSLLPPENVARRRTLAKLRESTVSAP
jgi:hypothetical protein